MDGQTIFAILVSAALACFSLIMVGYSFFRGNEARAGATLKGDGSSDEGVGLDSIYDSIDTLELEHQLGNIPEAQYREQLQAYRLQAAAIIKAQVEKGDAAPEIALEREVLAARNEMRSSGSSSSGFNSSGLNSRPCPQCDAPLPEPASGSPDTSCPHCGAAMNVDSYNGQDAPESESRAQVQ